MWFENYSDFTNFQYFGHLMWRANSLEKTLMLLYSVTKSCPTLCNSIDCSTPGFPVVHCLPEFAQIQVHWVSDVIQPSHPLSSSFPPALNLSQHQGLFQWVGSSHQVAKVLEVCEVWVVLKPHLVSLSPIYLLRLAVCTYVLSHTAEWKYQEGKMSLFIFQHQSLFTLDTVIHILCSYPSLSCVQLFVTRGL